MSSLEEKAAAAASLYVQQALKKTESQAECWTAKEDYTAGYLFGTENERLRNKAKADKAVKNLVELLRVADARGEHYSSSMVRYVLEILK